MNHLGLTDRQQVREFERRYWGAYHPLCLSCEKSCKQSRLVVLRCPSRVPIKKLPKG